MAQRETELIVNPFCGLLKHRGWTVKNFHGNQYQAGVPDSYIMHPDYTPRWVEFKVVEPRKGSSGAVHLTKHQKITFPIWHANGVPIYIIAAPDLRGSDNQQLRERLYKKLFEKPNVLFAMSKRSQSLLY